MRKWIRWWGLGVFFIWMGVVSLVWLFVVDGLVKAKIE